VALTVNVVSGASAHVGLGQVTFIDLRAATETDVLGVVNWWPSSAFGGVIAGGVMALAVAVCALRLRGPYPTLFTLALAYAAMQLVLEKRYVLGPAGEKAGWPEIGTVRFASVNADLVLVVGAHVASMRVVPRPLQSPWGRALAILEAKEPLAALSRDSVERRTGLVLTRMAAEDRAASVIDGHDIRVWMRTLLALPAPGQGANSAQVALVLHGRPYGANRLSRRQM
jgi:hypothetical protein